MTLVLSMIHRGQVPSMNRKARIEKDPGLEAGEGRVILDKELPGVTEDQPRTLGLDLLFTHEHLMGRSIVLHLLARTKFISS